MAMELNNNMSAIKVSTNKSCAAHKLKKIGQYGELNAMEMAVFSFLLTKMSFKDIAEAYFDACDEWAKVDFVRCSEFSSAPWRATVIKDYLLSRCHPDIRGEMEDNLKRHDALASDAGEQGVTGLFLYGEEDEWEAQALIHHIGKMPRLKKFINPSACMGL